MNNIYASVLELLLAIEKLKIQKKNKVLRLIRDRVLDWSSENDHRTKIKYNLPSQSLVVTATVNLTIRRPAQIKSARVRFVYDESFASPFHRSSYVCPSNTKREETFFTISTSGKDIC